MHYRRSFQHLPSGRCRSPGSSTRVCLLLFLHHDWISPRDLTLKTEVFELFLWFEWTFFWRYCSRWGAWSWCCSFFLSSGLFAGERIIFVSSKFALVRAKTSVVSVSTSLSGLCPERDLTSHLLLLYLIIVPIEVMLFKEVALTSLLRRGNPVAALIFQIPKQPGAKQHSQLCPMLGSKFQGSTSGAGRIRS